MKALAQEVVEKFSSKLRPLGLVVRELTGDMQLTRAEAAAAHVLVTVRGDRRTIVTQLR
jgi:activating signal cointegrator complex subunit 3